MLLSTGRLVLRRFRADDAAALATYRSNPEIARYQSWSAPVSLEAAATLIREVAMRDTDRPGWFQYAVELRSDRTLIGDIGVNTHESRLHAEIGFTIAAGYQRCGYGTEAVGRVLEHLFVDRGLHRVSAECDVRNRRSARLLERLGFRREAYRVADTWLKGEWTDELHFGLRADEWQRTF